MPISLPIPQPVPAFTEAADRPMVQNNTPLLQVALADIFLNPSQPRKHFSAQALHDLAASLKAQGIIQPLAVRPHPQREHAWEMIAGERRLRAMRLLGWQTAPVMVHKVDDVQLLELALVENVQREALTPLEEAQAYRALQQRFGYSQQALAQKIGKQRPTIANMLRLLTLPHALQADLNAQRLTMGHARALLGLRHLEQQLALGKHVIAQGLTVRQTEALVRKTLRKPKPQPSQPNPNLPTHAQPSHAERFANPTAQQAQLEHARQRLEKHLNTRVNINWNETANQMGSIQLAFHSDEEFNHLFEKLLKP